MNHSNFNSENTILSGAIFCIVLLSALQFISCKNFLNAKDIKNEIEEAIAYNNAKEITLQIDSDGKGLITPNGAVTKKTGYEFEITYKPDTQNFAIKDINNLLKAVDYYNHEQIYDSQSVSFSTLPQSDEDKMNGLYHIKVLVKTEIKNLLIIPTCLPVPQVKSYYPPFDNAGYAQDTSIQITFSSPVSLDNFVDENGYLKNISIFNGDTDLLDRSGNKLPYFSNPRISDDGTILTIPTVGGNYLISNTDTERIKDVSVTLNLKEVKDTNGTSFKEDTLSFSYRVNSTKDQTPPVFKKLNIARTKEDAINGTNLISIGNSLANFSDNSESGRAHVIEHHVKDIWVYFEAEDEVSGVQSLEVTEKLLYTSEANEAYEDSYSRTIENENMSNKNFSGVFNYVFDTFGDGLVDVIFSLTDRADSKTSQNNATEVLLIKDTTGCADFNIIKNDYTVVNNQQTVSFDFFIQLLEAGSPFWKIKTESRGYSCYENLYKTTYEYVVYTKQTLLSIKYGYDLENLISLPLPDSFSYDDRGYPGYNLSLNINPYKSVYIQVIEEDSVGNIKEEVKEIPPAQKAAAYEIKEVTTTIGETTETKTKLCLYGVDFGAYTCGYFELRDVDGTLLKKSAETGVIPLSNDIIGYMVYIGGMQFLGIYEITWDDNTTTKIEDLNSGFLSIYVLSSSIYGDDSCYYKGEPITINLSKSASSVLDADIPVFEVEKLPFIQNSGTTSFVVKNFRTSQGGNFEPESQYSYFLKYYKSTDEINSRYQRIHSFEEPIDIEITNDVCEYVFQIMVADDQGKICYSAPKTVSVRKEDDSTPPSIGIDNSSWADDFCIWWEASTNRLVIKDFIRESGIGLPEEDYEDEYGPFELD